MRAKANSTALSDAIKDQVKKLTQAQDARLAELAGQMQALVQSFTRERAEATRASEAMEQRLVGLQESLQLVDARDSEAVTALSGRLEILAANVNEAQAKPPETMSDARIAELSNNFETLNGALDVLQKGVIEAGTATEQKLALLQEGFTSLNEKQTEIVSKLAQSEESDAATVSSIAKLSDVIAKFEARLSDSTLDQRVSGIEHSLHELLNRTPDGSMPVPGTPAGQVVLAELPPPVGETAVAPEEPIGSHIEVPPAVDDARAEHIDELPPPADAHDDVHTVLEDLPPPVSIGLPIESAVAADEPKLPSNYLAAAREAANAATRAKVEIVGTKLLELKTAAATLHGRSLRKPDSSVGGGRRTLGDLGDRRGNGPALCHTRSPS